MSKHLVSIVTTLTLILPMTVVRADDATALKLCDSALTACEARVKVMDEMLTAEAELRRKVTEQRDAAISKLDEGATTKWYVWLVLGVAGGVVLTRGLR